MRLSRPNFDPNTHDKFLSHFCIDINKLIRTSVY